MSDSPTVAKYAVTVLCVDDEEDILSILLPRVERLAEKCFVTTDSMKAADILKKEKVDLVISDLKMPNKDGITMFRELKAISPKLEGVFLTGFGDKKTVQEAIRLGAFDFIDKPFSDSALLATLRRVMEHIEYEKLIDEMMKMFFVQNTGVDFSKFGEHLFQDKVKLIRAALGVVEMREARKAQQGSQK